MPETLKSALWGQTAPIKRMRIIMAVELQVRAPPNSGITPSELTG